MFTYGDSFESALKDAQERGYAERNPDADVLGTDAARKITILAALATGKLADVNKIHTEGITGIRGEDVAVAEKLGCSIKLLGRCIIGEGDPFILVAPFMLPSTSALSGVSDVYNAVEVVSCPLDNVMFYGRGAGAGPTASAVVGDLMQTMRIGTGDTPSFEKSDAVAPFSEFTSKHYIALPKSALNEAKSIFSDASFIESDECAFITSEISEGELERKLSNLSASPLSHIRML
jgi:homoserine dehydrogenase